jgi:hypothetical protein
MDLRSSKAKLFLIELVIIILFFSFAGGICMNMFAAAKRLSTRSADVTSASMMAQAAAEAVKSGGEQGFLDAITGAEGTNGSYRVAYDAQWDAVPEGQGIYTMHVDLSRQDNGILNADVTVKRMDDELFHITAKRLDEMRG